MMWRNSGSFSSTLVSHTRLNSLLAPLLSPYRGHPGGGGGGGGGGILTVLFAPLSSSHLHSSTSGIPSPFGSVKSGLTKSLQSRPFILSPCSSSDAAATALSPSSSISNVARDATDALRHYSRCYWELSKACLSKVTISLRYVDLVSVLPTRIRVLAWPLHSSKRMATPSTTANRRPNVAQAVPSRLSYAEDALRTLSLPQAYAEIVLNLPRALQQTFPYLDKNPSEKSTGAAPL